MCSKQKDTPVMALTPSKCLLSTQPHHKDRARARAHECVCVRQQLRISDDSLMIPGSSATRG